MIVIQYYSILYFRLGILLYFMDNTFKRSKLKKKEKLIIKKYLDLIFYFA
jgi:hypothetical protein